MTSAGNIMICIHANLLLCLLTSQWRSTRYGLSHHTFHISALDGSGLLGSRSSCFTSGKHLPKSREKITGGPWIWYKEEKTLFLLGFTSKILNTFFSSHMRATCITDNSLVHLIALKYTIRTINYQVSYNEVCFVIFHSFPFSPSQVH